MAKLNLKPMQIEFSFACEILEALRNALELTRAQAKIQWKVSPDLKESLDKGWDRICKLQGMIDQHRAEDAKEKGVYPFNK